MKITISKTQWESLDKKAQINQETGKKTVNLKFVIDDKDKHLFENGVQKTFEGENVLTLGYFPMINCSVRDATNEEIAWRQKHDEEI